MGDDTITGKKFPGYEFDDFDGCVSTFADEASVDDPEAFCAWLDEEGAEALSDPNAEEVLAGLEVEFVSAVDRPAQDSEWLIAKNQSDPDGDSHRWQSEVTLYVDKSSKADDGDAKQIAFAPALVPKEADKDGDIIPRPAIEDAAHTYLAEYRKVDSDHDLRDGKGTPVESWTLKQDTSFELPDGSDSREYPAGTWVMGIKFDDETWDRVQSGELSGLSIYGGAQPIDADTLRSDGGTDTQMNETTDGECPTCDVDAIEPTIAKSEADVPEWFTLAHKREEDPCWEDYVMVGMKPDPNGDGQVPNCVPQEDADEPDRMGAENMSVVDAWNQYMESKSDPDGTGNGDSGTAKQVDAGAVTGMLGKVGESDEYSPDTSLKDFVVSLVQNGDVDEADVSNMSVLLASGDDGMGDGMGDDEDDDEDDDEEMATDDGIDLNVDEGKSEDDGDDDVEKSTGDDRVEEVASAVESLAETVEDLQKQINDEPFADKMSDEDILSDRIAKEITGKDDPEVARKAIAEQVAKNDGDRDDFDYEGITDGEGVSAEATETTSNHSKAANTRMTGDN